MWKAEGYTPIPDQKRNANLTSFLLSKTLSNHKNAFGSTGSGVKGGTKQMTTSWAREEFRARGSTPFLDVGPTRSD